MSCFTHNYSQAMEALVTKGLVKAIGLSNFTITKTEHILRSAKIVPAVNQVECHPYFQQKKLKKYCDKKGDTDNYYSPALVLEILLPWHSPLFHTLTGIVFEAYAPIGSPARTFKPADEPAVMEDPVVTTTAAKHNATPAQVWYGNADAR